MTRYKIAFNRMALKEKLPKGDRRWDEFTRGWDNLSLSPIEIADQIYKGYSFSSWYIDGYRCNDNFILAQHIAVDMDTQDDRSRLDVLMEHPLVRMYGSILYTTPSHTEAAPRARILFLLDSTINDMAGYKEAIRFLTYQFNGADPSCVDSARFLYGSFGCDIRIPDNVLPLGVLRRYYRRWMATQPKTAPVAAPVISLDAERQRRRADVLAGAVPDELDKVREALAKIDPWSLDYNRWIGVIAAIKREFGDAGLPVADAWAKGKPGEVQREWARVKDNRSAQMHIGTIYYLAAGKR